eukprot:CAMPEP_0177592306 /NCGR_PEP_ID=MMETSP0419_2-20121207/8485_1 /TAXON_ID=582737 /ORGANISM="Tetraselmis sp., Strain GSL018" /LENGTH=278 /DNA_ID=CAMNT_0019083155 /DNA_START=723 /DNA_END=1559 /DNA_ORIENTATION=+
MTLSPGTNPAKQRKRAKLVLTLGHSIQATNTTRKFVVVLAGDKEAMPGEVLDAFEKAGFVVELVKHQAPPKWARKRFQFSFSKLQVRGLTKYSKVVLLDNDMVVVRNIDSLFSVPAPAGVAEPARVKVGKSGRGGRKPVTPGAKSILCSNGGLQIFVPSEQHLAELESKLYSGKCKSYNEGEQGFLCVAIKRWHEVPYEYDTFVSSWLSDPADFRKARVLHYIMMSSEPDFCYSAFKRGTGCGREARVRFMRPPQMVATFWKMYMAMEAAYGLDLSSW